ncbi:hypothetical protein [uncultured Roseobacter sp.]|uniref:hypothetical protein n=1 Tax=uncultured Roseobacter sp. TaxID=114847 RepID=UPI00260198F0|nr:hypothetical protein [uncultured Roseobacter sp.]
MPIHTAATSHGEDRCHISKPTNRAGLVLLRLGHWITGLISPQDAGRTTCGRKPGNTVPQVFVLHRNAVSTGFIQQVPERSD